VAYDEAGVAEKIDALSEEVYIKLQQRAFHYACSEDPVSGKTMILAKACAMAAIEIVEGKPRSPKRKKRRF
jgi:hypothetical protein